MEKEINFKGKGEHSIHELEKIAERYEELKHEINSSRLERGRLWNRWTMHKYSCEVNYEANGDCDCGWIEAKEKVVI